MRVFLENAGACGSSLTFKSDLVTGFDILASVPADHRTSVIAMYVDGILSDLSASVSNESSVRLVKSSEDDGIGIIRHSCAHLMAYAVKQLFENSKVAIGPIVENGFYYDFDLDVSLSEEDFPKIEEKMRQLIKGNDKVEKFVWSRAETIAFFTKAHESYKLELLDSIPAQEKITIYKSGDFVDLCRGPHVQSLGKISKHFKLMKVAGAYWRGNSSNKMLQRIYAVCFNSREELDSYLQMIEEAGNRDHRKLGKQMNLFHLQEEAVGSIFWHPRGFTIYRCLENFVRDKVLQNGYMEVRTPQLMDKSIWQTSGHWDKFRDNMFIVHDESADGKVMCIKPMNCPAHISIYKTDLVSYKKLPMRYAEFGVCHRNESSGSMHGIMRLRAFVQDDGHIFCTPEQINSETVLFCDLLKDIYKDLGFEKIKIKYSDRPDVRAGTDDVWDIAEEALLKAANGAGLDVIYNKGEGAFYGPKLEFVLQDAIGRDWQCGTLQVDFILPERFGAEYVGEDGKKHTVVLLHRAVLGSLERFIGILLENYGGNLPIWLAPEHIVLATVTSSVDDYAVELNHAFLGAGVRSIVDVRNEKISYKIREHSVAKIPLIGIIGEKEKAEKSITIRKMGSNNVETMTFDEIVNITKRK